MELANVLVAVSLLVHYGGAGKPNICEGKSVNCKSQFLYQASLQMYGEHFCGGSIIDSRTIITAAHCVEGGVRPSQVIVVTGTARWRQGVDRYRVKCIRMHPNYTGRVQEGYLHDIAVITLESPIQFDRYQSPIPLATRDYSLEPNRYRGLVSGFGKTLVNSGSSPTLRWIDVDILTQGECLREHSAPSGKYICTRGKHGRGACWGDSGAVLAVNQELAGASVPCALGVPDVFTNVFYYKDFIKDAQARC